MKIGLCFLLSFVALLHPAPGGGQALPQPDFDGYVRLGPYRSDHTTRYRYPAPGKADIWSCWQSRKRCAVTIESVSRDGKQAELHYFIAPHEGGEWGVKVVVFRWEVSGDGEWQPSKSDGFFDQVTRLQPRSPGPHAPRVSIPPDAEVPADRYGILLTNSATGRETYLF